MQEPDPLRLRCGGPVPADLFEAAAAAGQGGAEQNPRAFLFSIASGIWKNECRKWGRRTDIAPSSSLEELLEQPPQEPPDGGDLQQQVLDRMCRQELARAVQRLEEKYRSPVILMYRFGMGIDEIARIERVPKGTIKSRLSRARKQLRKEMEERGYAQEF